MTVEKGQAWGEPVTEELDGLVVAPSDAELARLAFGSHEQGKKLTAGVHAGDLLQTLGLAGRRSAESRHAYPMDLALAVLDGRPEPEPFVAHLVARRRPWIGAGVVAMNAAWWHDLRLGPKAHPNDGLIDVTTGRIPIMQRREARRRARDGSHVPHPLLTTTRARTWSIELAAPVTVWLDSIPRGRFRSIEITVVPDAFVLVA